VAARRGNDNRILAFRLDGGATPVPPELPPVGPIPEPPAQAGTPEDVTAGAALFAANCGSCHANFERAPVPDLRRSGIIRDKAAFASVVLGGALQQRGMPAWDDLLDATQTEQIRAHVVSVATQAYEAQQKGAAAAPAPAAPREGHL
jgi:quinohemoprotein ethanol dehydrogenase